MLQIYPEKRPSAFEMLGHRWMKAKLRDYRHILTDVHQIEHNIQQFRNTLMFKTDPVFYRELKDYSEEINDADVSFDMEDETSNPDVGFSRCYLPRQGT